MPRPRYVAFRLQAAKPLSRKAVANAIKGHARKAGWADVDAPVLTRYAWPDGIVRVEHTHAAKARELVGSLDWAQEGDARVAVKASTVSTSGTLAALTSRTKTLGKRDPPK